MLSVNKNLEVDFYCIILSFDLPVGLKVESCKKLSLDVGEIIKQKPELKYENWALVIDYWLL